MRTFLRFFLCCFLSLPAAQAASGEAARVVVLANKNDAESVRIAEHYAARRSIPEANLIALPMPTAETISLEDYVRTIHNPLLEALLEKEFVSGVKAGSPDEWGRERLSVAVPSISYLVTVRGVPLRFENAPEGRTDAPANAPEQFKVTRASVDSELSLLAGPPGVPLGAFAENPLFGGSAASGADAGRVIRTSRLDGPSAASVIRLIDRTLEAERTGLAGRAYFDIGGPHGKGDEWLNEAGDLAKAAHFETDFETTKRPMDERDRLDAPAIYMGWYRPNAYGPWRAPRWSVPPGAIAYHLHSFSAVTVRSETQAWIGAFVKQGYCATVGYVFEPYLEFTFRPQMLLRRLLEGKTFGEAAWFSRPVLSWQEVAIGDPLYRPFAVGLPAQLEQTDAPFAAYAILREIRRKQVEEGIEPALDYAKANFVRYPSLALAYRLAKLYEEAGRPEEGVEALKIVRYIGSFSRDEYPLVARIADYLDAHGASQLGFEVYRKLLEDRQLPKGLRIALLRAGTTVAANAGQSAEASRWPLQARQLEAPAQAN